MSAGLLMFRRRPRLEVFLIHPGGPFFRGKDVWSIPKGEPLPDEDLRLCALREFEEETGVRPTGLLFPIGQVRQKGGKVVHAWAFEGDWDGVLRSNTFSLEWPPRSGRMQEFPEADRAAFFEPDEAKRRIIEAQAAFIERVEALPERPSI